MGNNPVGGRARVGRCSAGVRQHCKIKYRQLLSTQPGPVGGCSPGDGRQGSMKPGQRVRDNM